MARVKKEYAEDRFDLVDFRLAAEQRVLDSRRKRRSRQVLKTVRVVLLVASFMVSWLLYQFAQTQIEDALPHHKSATVDYT